MKRAVAAAHEDRSVGEGGGARRRRAKRRSPLLLSGRGIEGVQTFLIATDVDHAIDDERRNRDDALRGKMPALFTDGSVDGVSVPSCAPAKTTPSATAGDVLIHDTLWSNRHRSFPDAASIA